ncbi:MAG: type II toxin-antitoxin system VapC family toxin [SAR324 cluster bacterium]|nr:type II toxin-antitoxin system VapC family toxin [SAR324 cluster bacterium]
MMNPDEWILFDAGLFIGALLKDDERHMESRPLVEAARHGKIQACTTTGILSEVYAALTWVGAKPPHTPEEASVAVGLLIEPPSQIKILSAGVEATLKMLELARKHELRARRVHDARHAAIALISEVNIVYTYDMDDWNEFESEGIHIIGPPSIIMKLNS